MPAIPVRAQEDIIRAGRRMDQRGWVPATAGNISVRLGRDSMAITRSGGHKGFLDSFSVIEVLLDSTVVTPDAKPSAETLLHCQIYNTFPDAGAVLHGHSVAGTVLTLCSAAPAITLAGYEVLKAFAGQTTHATSVDLPVFDNDQDMARLASVIAPHLSSAAIGYYIRGHGVYVWGRDMDQAMNHLEALEFLLECELERRKLG